LRSYQSVLILKPDLDEAQVDQVLEKITEFLSKNNGSIVKVEKWGKKRLAYRVKKSRLKVSALEADYKLYDLILKFLVIRLDDKDLGLAMKREYEDGVEEEKKKPARN